MTYWSEAMTSTVEAVYESGVFKPTQAVDLPEGQTVRITLELMAPSPASSVREALQSTGRLRELSPQLKQKIVPGATLEQVREALGRAAGMPLSEIVIEQRGPKE